jgi:hypothetical protein
LLYIYVTVCIVMLWPFTWKKTRVFVISSPLFIKKGRIRPAIWLGWSNHQEKLYFRSEETASGNSTYMVIFSRSSISMDHLYHSYATYEATSDLEFHLQSLTCNQVMQETPNIPWNLKIHSRRFPLWSTIVTISFTTNQKGILYIYTHVCNYKLLGLHHNWLNISESFSATADHASCRATNKFFSWSCFSLGTCQKPRDGDLLRSSF